MKLKPTGKNVLLRVVEQKLAGGLVVEGQGDYSDFFIEDIGKEVDKEFKKGMKAHLGMASVPTRTIDGKKYAIVEDFNIICLES